MHIHKREGKEKAPKYTERNKGKIRKRERREKKVQ